MRRSYTISIFLCFLVYIRNSYGGNTNIPRKKPIPLPHIRPPPQNHHHVGGNNGESQERINLQDRPAQYGNNPGENYRESVSYNAIPKNTSHCSAVNIHPKPKPITKDNKYGLWPGLMSQNDLASGSVLYGFEEAMDIIWKTQNPPDCRKAKYYIVEGFMQGFGSEFHIYGVALAIAVDHGRVLLQRGGWQWRYKNDFCQSQGKDNLECYYHPWSKCTFEDAYYAQYAEERDTIQYHQDVKKLATTQQPQEWKDADDSALLNAVFQYGNRGKWHMIAKAVTGKTPFACLMRWRNSVRERAKHRMDLGAKRIEEVVHKDDRNMVDIPFDNLQVLSAYRALDAKVIFQTMHVEVAPKPVHINEKIKSDAVIVLGEEIFFKVRPYTPQIFFQYLDCTPLPRFWYFLWWRGIAITYFLRPNEKTLAWLEANRDQSLLKKYDGKCIATYVRHGDKAIEMQLMPLSRYTNTAMTVWSRPRNTIPGFETTASEAADVVLPKVFYVSSEDYLVFRDADTWGKEQGIEIHYSNISQSLLADKQRAIKQRDLEQRVGSRHYEYLSYLLHVTDILSCEVVICTWPSNYCRVIDELRTTIGGKANRLSIDIGAETCPQTPCIRPYGLGNHVGNVHDPKDRIW